MNIENHGGQTGRTSRLNTIVLAAFGTLHRAGAAHLPVLFVLCGLCAVAFYPRMALASGTPSPSGTEVPSAAEITDSQGNTWTLLSNGDIDKNGARDNSSWNVSLLLFYQGVLYQQTKSHAWYSFNGHHWAPYTGGNPETSPHPSHPVAPPTVRTPVPVSGLAQRSITEFGVQCNGTDQYANVQNAFNAAANDAFELVVDCPVTIHTARLPNRTVFIGSGTTVSFTSAGTFYVDNVLQPAFAIMNSSNIKLYDWSIVYTGSLGVALPDHTGNIFNDETATAWLNQNRHINFNTASSGQHSMWQDTYNTGGMFFIVGDDSNILFSGFHIVAETVLKAAGASPLPVSAAAGFVPCVFTFGSNWKGGSAGSPIEGYKDQTMTSSNATGPTLLTFENITLDGTIMGFVGSGITNSTFTNITSIHYSDVQDVNGNHIGGDIDPSNNGPWTPPPHLFYLVNDTLATPVRANANLTFTNIEDATFDSEGRAITYDRIHQTNPDRVGGPRDTVAILKRDNRPQSGYALSMKLMCGVSAATAAQGTNGGCLIENYRSYRPDGFLAVSNMNNVTFENVTATFDSNYTDGLPMYRPGLWFPGGYSNLTFKNVKLTDVAAHPLNEPIGYSEDYSGLHFVDVDAGTNSTGVLIYVAAAPEQGVHLYDNNHGQTADSTRYYYVGTDDPIFVAP
jgi:hypothetical protein